MILAKARKHLRTHADAKKAVTYRGFFKTAENDTFLGVTAPLMRTVAKAWRDLSFEDIRPLMVSNIHDERSLAHSILRLQFDKGDEKVKERVYKFYMKHRGAIRQWDGVDDSAPYIVGSYLFTRDHAVLYKMASAKSLWDRRIAIVSTWHFIRNGQLDDTFSLAEVLLDDDEDLIHKATGWMLREAGKRDEKRLKTFLTKHAPVMPRTMLRYALEKFPEAVYGDEVSPTQTKAGSTLTPPPLPPNHHPKPSLYG